MKRLTLFPFATLFALAASSQFAAADPQSAFGLAPTSESLQPSQPAQAPQPSTGNPLIPEAVQPLEKAAADAAKQKDNQTVIEDDKLHKRVKIRQALTKAQRDPHLQAIMARAYKVDTDFEQRQIFIDYYNGLCALVLKIDPTLNKDDVEAMRKLYTGRYYEARIAPTVDPATFRKKQN
jgi:hypothetical protein